MPSYVNSEKYGRLVRSQTGGKSWQVEVSEGHRTLCFGTHSTEDQAGEALAWYTLSYCLQALTCYGRWKRSSNKNTVPNAPPV